MMSTMVNPLQQCMNDSDIAAFNFTTAPPAMALMRSTAASSDASPILLSFPPMLRARSHSSALASSMALLYPTLDHLVQSCTITVVVYLHNILLLALAYFCMRAKKKSLLFILFTWLITLPWVCDNYWHTSVTERQLISYITVVLHGFRLLRVMGGMLPEEAQTNFLSYMMFCTLPGELKISESGTLCRAPRGELIRRYLPAWLFHTLCLYLMGYVHQLATMFLPSIGNNSLDVFAFPHTIIDAGSLYIAAAYGSFFGCMVCALFGYDSELPFMLPWQAQTFRELWGKRWNRSVQVHLNRIFFVPLHRKGWPGVGGFCAFAYSAVFHEYIWWFNFRSDYRFGENTKFFMLMYAICCVEQKCSKIFKIDIARPVRMVVVAATCIFFSRLVTATCHRAGAFVDIGSYFPRIVHTQAGEVHVRALQHSHPEF